VPELPPNAVRAPSAVESGTNNKQQYFSRLGVEFRSLLAALRGTSGVAAFGPVEGVGARGVAGQLEACPRVASGRRTPGGEPELLGEVLDPLCRSLAAALSPSLLAAAAPSAPSAGSLVGSSPAAASVAELAAVEEAVRRVAWGGDRRAGVARIELGGAHVGTAIVVRGAGRAVALSIELGSSSSAGSLPERLVERLKARGLTVTDVEVR
jgi:hypothetical protein